MQEPTLWPRDFVALEETPLRDAAVLGARLGNPDAVVNQIVVNDAATNSEFLCGKRMGVKNVKIQSNFQTHFVDGIHKVTVESQNFAVKSDKGRNRRAQGVPGSRAPTNSGSCSWKNALRTVLAARVHDRHAILVIEKVRLSMILLSLKKKIIFWNDHSKSSNRSPPNQPGRRTYFLVCES